MNDPVTASHLDQLVMLLNPLLGTRQGALHLETRTLRGGIDSAGVSQITARFSTDGRQRSRRIVWKRLLGPQTREARIYKEVLGRIDLRIAPGVAGVRHNPGECWLFLESIRPINDWPWRDAAMPAQVLRALARLHTAWRPQPGHVSWLSEWDYETELADRARTLVATIERAEFQAIREKTGAVRRLAGSLPAWRKWMLDLPSFDRTFIHGDVHPGNVMMRKRRGGATPVLLDWGRSRIGSPLEDVSSWLQSLGYWEPTARRRHDSLLLEYLDARGQPRRLTRELRDAYWLAAASNLLGGAILYHLSILTDPASSVARRADAIGAARDGLRVICRADACWRSRAP